MKAFLRAGWLPRVISAALAAFLLSACGTVRFYTQAARGQWEILSKRKPVRELLRDPGLDAKLARQLRVTQEIRAFAKDRLGLPAEGQYDTYVDLRRDHVVWVVFAAPEFSVEAKRWWYPVVGGLEYRGYFRKEDAAAEARKLRAQGWDVAAGGVVAYSTLGFFRDPLLNTFIQDPDTALAELLFHELTHQEVFLRGDTDFNEAFATATAREGVRRWLREKGDARGLEKYEKELEEEDAFAALALQTRERLRLLYERAKDEPLDRRRALKQEEFTAFRSRVAQLPSLRQRRAYASWFSAPVNNARLNTVDSYHAMVPGFERLLAAHGGDLKRYFAAVKAMGSLTKAERRERLMQGG